MSVLFYAVKWRQLHVAFVMLPAKYYKHIFNFVKDINRNTVSFFTSDIIKMAFLMTS